MFSIALFNDTGNYPHVGCLAVSQAHLEMLKRENIGVKYRHFVNEYGDIWKGNRVDSRDAILQSNIINELHSVDAVVVNGEGTIHHGGGLHLLAILAMAQEIGKPTFVVNAVIQDNPEYLDVLSSLADFTVRDLYSSQYLSKLNIKHRIVPDSILEAKFAEKPDSDFSDKIVVTDFHQSRKNDVGQAMTSFLSEVKGNGVYYPLEHPDRFKDWEHAVANLRLCKILITGRHHGLYLAALSEVPFLALPSNTHKIEGLLALFDKNIKLCNNNSDIKRMYDWALKNRNFFIEFSGFLKAYVPLTTFEKLSDISRERNNKDKGNRSGFISPYRQ